MIRPPNVRWPWLLAAIPVAAGIVIAFLQANAESDALPSAATWFAYTTCSLPILPAIRTLHALDGGLWHRSPVFFFAVASGMSALAYGATAWALERIRYRLAAPRTATAPGRQ